MAKDARGLTHKALTELRKRGVAAVSAGETPASVAAALGVSRRTVFRWMALYRSGGSGKLEAGKRGGRPKKLNRQEVRWLYETVTEKSPAQLGFPSALWTATILRKLIAGKFQVHLSLSSVFRLLGRMGLNVYRPLRRGSPQDPEALRRWKEDEYPKLRRRVWGMGWQLFFAGEAGPPSDSRRGRNGDQDGRTVWSAGAQSGIRTLFAVSSRGELCFMVTQGRVTAAVFVEFLKRLTASVSSSIVLIVEDRPAHRARVVEGFVQEQEGRLRLHYLPGGSLGTARDEPLSSWRPPATGKARRQAPAVLVKDRIRPSR